MKVRMSVGNPQTYDEELGISLDITPDEAKQVAADRKLVDFLKEIISHAMQGWSEILKERKSPQTSTSVH